MIETEKKPTTAAGQNMNKMGSTVSGWSLAVFLWDQLFKSGCIGLRKTVPVGFVDQLFQPA